jgi:hypothetical protein
MPHRPPQILQSSGAAGGTLIQDPAKQVRHSVSRPVRAEQSGPVQRVESIQSIHHNLECAPCVAGPAALPRHNMQRLPPPVRLRGHARGPRRADTAPAARLGARVWRQRPSCWPCRGAVPVSGKLAPGRHLRLRSIATRLMSTLTRPRSATQSLPQWCAFLSVDRSRYETTKTMFVPIQNGLRTCPQARSAFGFCNSLTVTGPSAGCRAAAWVG